MRSLTVKKEEGKKYSKRCKEIEKRTENIFAIYSLSCMADICKGMLIYLCTYACICMVCVCRHIRIHVETYVLMYVCVEREMGLLC